MQRIYLDNNATTALDPRVCEAMLQEMRGPPSNPSSIHSFGRSARTMLSDARSQIASFFHASPSEIFFNSGGTEGLNALIQSARLKGEIITTRIEHAAIRKSIEHSKAAVQYVPVGSSGAPQAKDIAPLIGPNTACMIFSAANSETGAKIDLKTICQMARERGVPLFIDAVGFIGKEPLDLDPAIQAIVFSAHKFHGPKGIGGLFLRKGNKIGPQILGGGQENGFRSGTENLAGILGLAKALAITQNEQEKISHHLLKMRNFFESGLKASLDDLIIHGENRICNTSNIAFLGVSAETLLMQLDLIGIAASHGSACSSNSIEPSHVLTQMGIDRNVVKSSVRFSFSRMNSMEEVERAILLISQKVKALRA